MANIQEAIQYAKLNPNSAFANELKSRIESGAMNNELKAAGLTQYLPEQTMTDKVVSTVKDYATEAVTNPLETAKGVVKGIPGQAAALTKLGKC